VNTLTLCLLVENNSGILSRVAGLFSRRGYSIESLTVGPTLQGNISRMVIVCIGDDVILHQIQAQLKKLVEVIEIYPLEEAQSVYRELMLIKIAANEKNRSSLVSIVDVFRAKIIDISPLSLTVEITGDVSKINGFLAMLEGFEILEIARTGLTGMKRGNVT